MGSQSFTTYSRGKNINDAYNKAVQAAEEEYGHQEGYSGEINSAGGFADVTKEFKASKKSLDKFIDEQIDKLTKFDGARAICIEQPVENKNTIKSQVEHIVTPGTKKWVLMYLELTVLSQKEKLLKWLVHILRNISAPPQSRWKEGLRKMHKLL